MSTKYIVVIGDGMADFPIEELNNKTILEYSNKPTMDYLAKNGKTGLAITVPNGYTPGSDVANMSIFGYDPNIYYTGRSPLEAVGMNIKVNEDDISFRCNLITIDTNDNFDNSTIVDYSGGHISDIEASELINCLSESLKKEFKDISFFSGKSYRNLMISKYKYSKDLICIPPHDIINQKIKENYPSGYGNDYFIRIIKRSFDILSKHPINHNRIKNGLLPANCIWLWGQGTTPKLPSFYSLYNKSGSVISAVDLLKGLGICSNLNIINVKNATGFLDTNYSGKVLSALESLNHNDIVFIHIEAPDECGHMGDYIKKIKAVENIDSFILYPILNHIKKSNNHYKILVLPDHPTPVKLKTHTSDPVPFLIYDSKEKNIDSVNKFDEFSVKSGFYKTVKAFDLMKILFSD